VRRAITLGAVAAVTIAVSAAAATGTAQAAPAPTAGPAALATGAAAALVAARPAQLHASAHDSFAARPVITSKQGLQYVPYQRTYQGLRVYGGDFVVVTDKAGQVLSTEVAQTKPIALTSLTPAVSGATAAATATKASKAATIDGVTANDTIVYGLDTPRLAYETVVAGHTGQRPSRLHVFVDATTGKVINSYDEVADGTGNGAIYGAVTISTSGSGTSFSMSDPTRAGISCRNINTGAVLTGTDDVWGNGVGTNLETGCVDALFTVQREWDMFGAWFGRVHRIVRRARQRFVELGRPTRDGERWERVINKVRAEESHLDTMRAAAWSGSSDMLMLSARQLQSTSKSLDRRFRRYLDRDLISSHRHVIALDP